MGLYEEGADKEGEHEKHKKKDFKKGKGKPQEPKSEEIKENVSGCCQGVNGVSCCQVPPANSEAKPKEACGSHGSKNLNCLSAWVGKWEQSDILMGAAVVGAVATVAVAYSFYRRSG